jgi:hypothetical protein
MMKEKLRDLVVTQIEFSYLVNSSTRTIRNKIVEGMPSLGRKGIPFVEAFRWWTENVIGRGDTESLTELKKEKMTIENELKRIELLLKQGELIPRAEILQLFLDRISVVKSGLLGLHRSLVFKLDRQDPHAWSGIIKAEVYDLLNKFSRRSGPLKK